MKAKRSTFKVLFYLKRTAVRVSDGKVPVMACTIQREAVCHPFPVAYQSRESERQDK